VEAQALASDAGDAVLAAAAAVRIPRLTRFLVPDRELESLLTDALEVLGDAAPVLRVRLLARRAVIAEDADDRRVHSDQAVQAAKQLGDEALLAEVLSARLYVLWAPDTAEERLVSSPQIIELAVRTGDVRRELDGRMWRLIALLEFGRVAEAEAELGRYERIAERLGQPEFLFFARSRRSALAALRGRFEEAEQLTRTAYDLAVRAGLPDAGYVLEAQLGVIALTRGGALLDEVLEIGARQGVPPMLQAFAALSRAYGLAVTGRGEEARALFPSGLSEINLDTVPGPSRWLYLGTTAEVAYRLGDAAARSVRDKLTPLCGLVRRRRRGCWVRRSGLPVPWVVRAHPRPARRRGQVAACGSGQQPPHRCGTVCGPRPGRAGHRAWPAGPAR
jgi:hypothetical protein